MRTARHRRHPAARRGGFTLTEIMIALGVLVVGMGMIAGALHAGIANHIQTVDDIIRTMVGQNALALVNARMEDAAAAAAFDDQPKLVGDTLLGSKDRTYPVAFATTRGFVAYMKEYREDENDYQLQVVPYVVEGEGEPDAGGYSIGVTTVDPAQVNISVGTGSEGTTTVSSRREIIKFLPGNQLGATVVQVQTNGETVLARVTAKSGRSSVILDEQLQPSNQAGLWVLSVRNSAGQIADGWEADFKEPFLARTALK